MAIFFSNWQFFLKSSCQSVFIGLMVWILVKTGHGYLFVIQKRKKWKTYGIQFWRFVAVLHITLNFKQLGMFSLPEGWAVLISYNETNLPSVGTLLNLFSRSSDGRGLIYRACSNMPSLKSGLTWFFLRFLFAPSLFDFPNSLIFLFLRHLRNLLLPGSNSIPSIYPVISFMLSIILSQHLPFLITQLHRIFS